MKDVIENAAENWENGTLGMDEKYVKKSKITMEDIEPTIGLKPISIRLKESLVDDLKLIASVENVGYQSLIKLLLQRFVDGEFKRYAREELHARSQALVEQQAEEAKELKQQKCA